MPRCTVLLSSVCATMLKQSCMRHDGWPKARPAVKSYAASNDTSSAKSSQRYAGRNRTRFPLDEYRSFNAAVETFFKTIKAELIWRRPWETRRQAETAIFQYINGFYNPRRRHSALGGKSPLAFERQVA